MRLVFYSAVTQASRVVLGGGSSETKARPKTLYKRFSYSYFEDQEPSIARRVPRVPGLCRTSTIEQSIDADTCHRGISCLGLHPSRHVDPEARARTHRSSETAIFEGALVQEILKSLTPEQFETMRLFFFEGYTLAEISENLGQPLGNVRHHYYRGLNKLRARLFLE